MTGSSRFTLRFDTLIVRVRDLDQAEHWYSRVLGALPQVRNDLEQLTVLELDGGTPLTLWQIKPGELFAPAALNSAYPIFYTGDAVLLRERLQAQQVEVDPLESRGDYCWFRFYDPDGNRLEACQPAQPRAARRPLWQTMRF